MIKTGDTSQISLLLYPQLKILNSKTKKIEKKTLTKYSTNGWDEETLSISITAKQSVHFNYMATFS